LQVQSRLIVDGDVVFDDQLDVEAVIDSAARELRAEFPAVTFVCLIPVAERRPRSATPAGAPLEASGNDVGAES
jgi:hypothetical protein